MSLMLCQHNQSFYDLSDYHSYLISSMNYEHKSWIIAESQRTFSNLSMNDTTDFQEIDDEV